MKKERGKEVSKKERCCRKDILCAASGSQLLLLLSIITFINRALITGDWGKTESEGGGRDKNRPKGMTQLEGNTE